MTENVTLQTSLYPTQHLHITTLVHFLQSFATPLPHPPHTSSAPKIMAHLRSVEVIGASALRSATSAGARQISSMPRVRRAKSGPSTNSLTVRRGAGSSVAMCAKPVRRKQTSGSCRSAGSASSRNVPPIIPTSVTSRPGLCCVNARSNTMTSILTPTLRGVVGRTANPRHRATWCRLAESRRKVPHIGVVRLGARPPRATPRLAVATAATPLLPVLNAARQIGAWYMAHLERHPILTKMVTSGVVFTLGDLGAQAIQNGPHAPIDKPRLAAAIGYGVLLSAPINHTIYNHLDALALNVLRLRRTPMIAFKVLFDQAVTATALTWTYHAFGRLVRGDDVRSAIDYAHASLWDTLKVCWVFWPAIQVFNFAMVPLALQVPYVTLACLCWAFIVSFISSPDAGTVST